MQSVWTSEAATTNTISNTVQKTFMKFTIEKTMEVLRQTPDTLIRLTTGLSPFWTGATEGGDTWSVYDVVGHLLHGEKTDWLSRIGIILAAAEDNHFTPFDRFAQFESSKGKSLDTLLGEFKQLRHRNLEYVQSLGITEADLSKTGIHPTFGSVTLRQLLSTWAVHDLDHIAQIARIMAFQYKEEVGPWSEFLRIVRS